MPPVTYFGKMLVAKVNLLQHASRVRAYNFDFALAGIELSE